MVNIILKASLLSVALQTFFYLSDQLVRIIAGKYIGQMLTMTVVDSCAFDQSNLLLSLNTFGPVFQE